jgi:hypothetical protein
MALPELAVTQSGFGGRGYILPVSGDEPFVTITKDGKKMHVACDADGKKLMFPSVTTVLKAAAQPGITQWAVDQTAAYAVANVDALLGRSETQGWNMLRWYHGRKPKPLEDGFDIRNYHEGVLNDAGEMGTAMHEWIEADLDPLVSYPDVSQQPELFWDMVPVWNEWRDAHELVTLYTEVTVYNMREGYAGTFDWIGYIDGILTLLDFKTSRSVWPEHKRQQAAICNADFMLVKEVVDGEATWKRLPLPIIEAVGLLHIRPDDVDKDGNPLLAYCEYVEVEDLDLHYSAFVGCLNMKKADIAVAIRDKEREASKATEQTESVQWLAVLSSETPDM